jgi:hypothetical protein
VVELVDAAPVVVVDEAGDLLRVGTLGEGLPIGDARLPVASGTPDAPGGPVTADSSGVLGGPGPLSLFALASLAGLSVLATVLRRRLLRRRLRFALIGRLAGLSARQTPARGAAASTDQGPAEPESG